MEESALSVYSVVVSNFLGAVESALQTATLCAQGKKWRTPL